MRSEHLKNPIQMFPVITAVRHMTDMLNPAKLIFTVIILCFCFNKLNTKQTMSNEKPNCFCLKYIYNEVFDMKFTPDVSNKLIQTYKKKKYIC